MNCHYVYDKKAGRVLIPGCIGSAVFGLYACTCNMKKGKTIEQRLTILEDKIKQLNN